MRPMRPNSCNFSDNLEAAENEKSRNALERYGLAHEHEWRGRRCSIRTTLPKLGPQTLRIPLTDVPPVRSRRHRAGTQLTNLIL